MISNLEKALGFKLEAFNLLYVLCDYETLLKKKISLENFVDLCKKKDVKIVQYRDKISSIEEQKKNLLYLKSSLNIPIIINDKIELIDFADGLHVGQEDLQAIHKDKKLAVKLIRLKIKDKLLGLSTHNELEILEANELALDMIGLGAYKATSTKDVSTILGSKISYLAKISKHPVCAIGGVKIDDVIENILSNRDVNKYITNEQILSIIEKDNTKLLSTIANNIDEFKNCDRCKIISHMVKHESAKVKVSLFTYSVSDLLSNEMLSELSNDKDFDVAYEAKKELKDRMKD